MDSSKKGIYSSVSPDHSLPNMVGMKSTTYGRGTSYDKTGASRRQIVDRPDYDLRDDPSASKY
jgi:hypothetical protein